MLRFSYIFFLCIILFSCGQAPEKKPPQQAYQSKHSAAFNQAIGGLLQQYDQLQEAFVNWDTAAVNAAASSLYQSIGSSWENKVEDPAIRGEAVEKANAIKQDLQSITGSKDITQKRRAFNTLSENMGSWLRTLRYDEKKLYLQECPMAFNDEEAGVWLTDKGQDSIRNPYLGLHHPKYKGAMLECGSNKSIIDFQK